MAGSPDSNKSFHVVIQEKRLNCYDLEGGSVASSPEPL